LIKVFFIENYKKDYSLILVKGHSKDSNVCSAVSAVMKFVEFECENKDIKFLAEKPGEFQIFYKKNDAFFCELKFVIKRFFSWLKLQYNNEIFLEEE
jgi:uncharacterized protein YsxB (DUF464 family)